MEAAALPPDSAASPTSTASYCPTDVSPSTANASRPTRTSPWTEPAEAQICTPAMKPSSATAAQRRDSVETVPIIAE